MTVSENTIAAESFSGFFNSLWDKAAKAAKKMAISAKKTMKSFKGWGKLWYFCDMNDFQGSSIVNTSCNKLLLYRKKRKFKQFVLGYHYRFEHFKQ